jgi:formate-dependent nitrite reductase cytochrome c552 subunit
MRLLGEATDLSQQARLQAARLLAGRGVDRPPKYPDVSTREKAWSVAQAFVQSDGPRLLP